MSHFRKLGGLVDSQSEAQPIFMACWIDYKGIFYYLVKNRDELPFGYLT